MNVVEHYLINKQQHMQFVIVCVTLGTGLALIDLVTFNNWDDLE